MGQSILGLNEYEPRDPDWKNRLDRESHAAIAAGTALVSALLCSMRGDYWQALLFVAGAAGVWLNAHAGAMNVSRSGKVAYLCAALAGMWLVRWGHSASYYLAAIGLLLTPTLMNSWRRVREHSELSFTEPEPNRFERQ